MDLTNLTKYPLTLLTDIQNVFNALRKEVKANSEYVRIVHDKDAKMVIEDLNFQSEFFFSIEKPRLDKEVKYTLTYSPSNKSTIKENVVQGIATQQRILSVFKNWLLTINTYKRINIHPANEVLKEYQRQFYNSFQFLDDEGDDKPLEPKKQKQLSQFLQSVITNFESDNEIDESLIEELRELNKCIPQLTQGQITGSLSSIFAKAYYKGIDIVNRVSNDGISAGLGYLLIEGIKKYFLGM